MYQNLKSRRAIVTLAMISACQPLIADDQPIDEIIVTADYRQRALSRLPLSISLLGQEKIAALAVQHFEELIAFIPNMNWSGDGNRARFFQIRGVGELAQYQGAPNPSIGFILDDIDFSGIGGIATLYDIERVEVLRGPQGTRYGANALGGLIYIQSASPGDDNANNVQFGAGQDGAFGAGIAYGGAIDNGLEYRGSLHHYQSNGFRDNAWLGRNDTNERNETSARAKIAWAGGDDWTFKLTGMFIDIDNGYDAFALDNSLTVLSNRPGRDAQQSVGASFRVDYSGSGGFDLTSISSFATSDIDFSFDADWGNDDAWFPVTYDYISTNDRKRRNLSQELRLTSTETIRIFGSNASWLAGVYLSRLDEDLRTLNQGEYFDPGINFADSLDNSLDSEFDARSVAMFGQLDFSVGENGELGVGLRVERRTTNYSDSDGLNVGPSENMIGGEVRYSHSINEMLTAYTGLSRGYKAGGFNIGFAPPGKREFEQESLWNFEVGAKSSLLDGQLLLNAAVFWNARRDQQVETSVQLNPNDPASFVFFTDNAAKGNAIGFEADANWHPGDRWEWYASVGLLRTEFVDFVTPLGDLSGRAQAHAPSFTLAGGGMYRHGNGAFARVDISAMDSFYFDVSHDQQSQAYALTNTRIGFETERWTTQLYVRNLFDQRYAVRGFYFGNEPPDFPPALYIRQGDPRQVGVTVDMRF